MKTHDENVKQLLKQLHLDFDSFFTVMAEAHVSIPCYYREQYFLKATCIHTAEQYDIKDLIFSSLTRSMSNNVRRTTNMLSDGRYM